MSEVISVKNVCKRFGKRTVLDNVSLTVPSGVVFALLGENGAGKSTLIRSMLGYTKLNSGSISVCGLDPLKQPLEIRRKVGDVSDAPGLYEWMTVAQAGWYVSGFYPEGVLESLRWFSLNEPVLTDTLPRMSILSRSSGLALRERFAQ